MVADPEVDDLGFAAAWVDRLAARAEGCGAAAGRDLVRRIAELITRLQAVQAVAAREVSSDPQYLRSVGAASAAGLFAADLGGDRRAAAGLLSRSEDLDPDRPAGAAFQSGVLPAVKFAIVHRALKNLPPEADSTVRLEAETRLVESAQVLSVDDLRRRADRICEDLLPAELVDALEAETVEQREERAFAKVRATLSARGDGTQVLTAVLPDRHADGLRTVLDSLGTPRRDHLDGSRAREMSGAGRRLGVSLCELIEGLPERVAGGAGSNVTLLVTAPEATLRGEIEKVGVSEFGSTISATTLRQLACVAGILPAVMSGASVLDVGSRRRLFPPAQRAALTVRDRGCTFPGCDRPPGWCEAHHLRAWEAGGPTTVANGALLCSHHHHLVHARSWEGRIVAEQVEWRAPGRDRWRRNARYRPD